METLVTIILTIITSIAASSGFWAWFQKRSERNSVGTQMLLGLAHDRLVCLTLQYIDRGFLSKEEFENLDKYLYVPYQKLGGNGTVGRLMDEVKKLPIKSSIHKTKEDKS